MCRNFIVAVALAAVTGGSLWAQTRTPEVQFKAAELKEQAEGDLKGAIKEYEKVVNSKNRELAAQALLRIAEIHRKFGEAEANKVYERLIRDFKDQPEAVSIARARLVRPVTAPGGTAPRFIPVPELRGILVRGASVSSDGRFIAYVNQARGQTVVVRDLRTGRERNVSPTAPDVKGNFVAYPVFSKDGRQLTYVWATAESWDLVVSNVEESGTPRFRRLLGDRYVQPFDWTPDGKSIVVAMTHHDKTADINLVSVADGSRRVLTPVEGGWSSIVVSPDGKYVARDHEVSATERQFDVFVMPINGGAEVPVVQHSATDRLVGWAPDGQHLLFTSDRGVGTPGLYAVRIVSGRPRDPRPLLLSMNVGTLAPVFNGIYPLGVTKTGALFYVGVDPADTLEIQEIEVASFNFDTGVMGPTTVIGGERQGLNSAPAWSRDGKFIAYRSAPTSTAQASVLIRSLDTGITREIRPGLAGMTQLQWSPDGRSLLTESPGNTGGIYRIDVETGAVSAIVVGPGKSVPRWSADGGTLYYRQADGDNGTVAFIARDLASGKERDIIRRPALGTLNLSPDGRYIATGIDDSAADSRAIAVIPTAGGEPRVLRVNRPRDGGVPLWTADSRSVLVRSSAKEIWRIPIDGTPVQLANDLPPSSAPVLHPDGSQIAVIRRSTPSAASTFQSGVRVLENFLPKASK